MTRKEIDEEIEKAQLTTNSEKTYEALSIARAMVKAHINYETIAKVCVDNALRAATIEIAGENEMPIMEFIERVGSGEYHVIRKEDTQIKPIPFPKRRSRKQHEMVEDRIHCDCGCEMIITGKWDKFLFCPTCGASLEHNEDYDYPGRRR